ncbi:hypothetical protein CANTEDRAFT_104536, partial [Yamadazyma tenuis ATCC 10573]
MSGISVGDFANVYGRNTPVDYFGLRLTGYLLATETGTYTIQFTKADNEASLSLGGYTDTLDCCSSSSNLPVEGSVYAHLLDTSGAVNTTVITVSLVAGEYYPVKIMYYQAGPGVASLELSIKYPDGDTHTDDIS